MAALLILVPFIGLLLVNLPGSLFRRAALPLTALLAALQLLVALALPAMLSTCPFFALGVDTLSRVMLLTIAIVVLTALAVGRGLIADETRRFEFVNLILLALIGMNGIVMVRDLFSLYIFIEIASVSSFILIALFRDRDGLEGAFKYLVLSALATAMMLGAIALFLMTAGGTSFNAVAAAVHQPAIPVLIWPAMALFLSGLLIKSGVMPFHGWLPDAYTAAPAGVSILLAGIMTKTTGVYVLVRMAVSVFGFSVELQTICLVTGAVSIVLGALAALGQSDFKRMLAYSSISQIGYIVLALGAGTALGLAGAILHLFNHAIFKSLLFVNAAAVEQQTGTRNMDQLGGVAARMPVTGVSSVIALLSTAGVPPLAGFWSKLIIIVALWQVGRYGYAVVAILASLLTLAYFLSMQRRVFFGPLRAGLENLREAPAAIIVPAVLLALITLGVGLLIPLIFGTFLLPIRGL